MRNFLLAAAAVAVSAVTSPTPAKAGADPYIGDVMVVGFNFCPRGWAELNGQILAINSNPALFSLLGTMYGGDGVTSFALPDLRSRSPIGSGRGPGLPDYRIGTKGGTESTTLSVANLPNHTHNVVGVPTAQLLATTNAPTTNDPEGNRIPTFPASETVYASSQGTPVPMADGTVDVLLQVDLGNAGGGIPYDNMQPALVLKYCMATQGLFPPRN